MPVQAMARSVEAALAAARAALPADEEQAVQLTYTAICEIALIVVIPRI